jgi:hypothetical protein
MVNKNHWKSCPKTGFGHIIGAIQAKIKHKNAVSAHKCEIIPLPSHNKRRMRYGEGWTAAQERGPSHNK